MASSSSSSPSTLSLLLVVVSNDVVSVLVLRKENPTLFCVLVGERRLAVMKGPMEGVEWWWTVEEEESDSVFTSALLPLINSTGGGVGNGGGVARRTEPPSRWGTWRERRLGLALGVFEEGGAGLGGGKK